MINSETQEEKYLGPPHEKGEGLVHVSTAHVCRFLDTCTVHRVYIKLGGAPDKSCVSLLMRAN